MCVIQCLHGHTTSDIIRPFLLSKSMMVLHTRRRLIVCDVQGLVSHATPDVRHCIISKIHDIKICLMSSGRECCLRAMIAYHVRHRPHVCVVQGDDGMPIPTLFDCVLFQGYYDLPHRKSSNCVCCPRPMIARHA